MIKIFKPKTPESLPAEVDGLIGESNAIVSFVEDTINSLTEVNDRIDAQVIEASARIQQLEIARDRAITQKKTNEKIANNFKNFLIQ